MPAAEATPAVNGPLKIALSATATMGACLFTNPIEVMKTRLQLQGEMQQTGAYVRTYRNTFHALYVVARTEGIRATQKGLVTGLMYQGVMNGTRLGSYDLARDLYSRKTGKTLGGAGDFLVAGTSGALGGFVGSPFFLIKTHMQAAGKAAVGHQHGYSGIMDGFRTVWGQGGLFGLWRGVSGAIPRVAVGSAVQVTTYNQCKLMVKSTLPDVQEGIAMHVLSGMSAGGFLAVAMNPFDLLSIRLYNQPVGPDGKGQFYKNYFDCIGKVVRSEGLFALYKGVGALYMRTGPHTILTFVFWEQLKKVVEGKNL